MIRSILYGLTNLGGTCIMLFVGAFVRLYSLNKSRKVHAYEKIGCYLLTGAPFKLVTVEI